MVLALAVAVFLATCGGPVINDDPDDLLDFTNVIYSPETGTMTLYLDGYAPVTTRQSRAINQQLAQMGHNFFEVVFVYGGHADTGNGVVPRRVTRLNWAWGESARTSDLYRTEGGIQYASITPDQDSGTGSAMLFVGTSADRTLLAVGRLTHVDNGNGSTPGTLISTATKSVTFTVSSLEAGLFNPTEDTIDLSQSSFLTAANGIPDHDTVNANNTWVELMQAGPLQVPYYRLSEPKHNFHAEYRFGGIDINTYVLASSIQVASPGTAEKKQPRFSLNDGTIFTPPGDLDTHTSVYMTNNQNAGVAFNNAVQFQIVPNSATHEGMIFALVFAVPVYALTGDPDAISGVNAVKWNIRPGFGTFMYDLDTGRDDGGGAIFMGTGELPEIIEENEGAQISVFKPPSKTRYDNTVYGMGFNIYGLIIELQNDLGEHVAWISNDNPNLSFWIGDNQISDGDELMSGLTGLIPVTVQYYDAAKGETYTATYYIIVGSDAIFANVRTRVIYNANDFNNACNAIPATGIMRMLLMNSVNIEDFTYNNGVNATLIIVAGAEGIILGRGGVNYNNLNSINLASTPALSAYLGLWPFAEELVIDLAETGYTGLGPYGYEETEEFTVNAGGSVANIYNAATLPDPPAVNALPRYMFRGPAGGGVLVRRGNGLSVWPDDDDEVNTQLLYYH